MSDFIYLNVHTHFSRAGGPASPDTWLKRARDLGYTSIAISDRSPLAGWPAAYLAAKSAGIGLIYGLEADILLPPESGRRGKPEPVVQSAVLIAHSIEGARNLTHLASSAYPGWPATEAAILWPTLATASEGLILILLGGDEAGAPQPITSTTPRQRDDWSSALKAAFPTNVYVGIPHSGRSGDTALAEVIASAAKSLDLPVVATPPVRYLDQNDAPAYESLKMARRKAGWPREVANASTVTTSIAPDRPGFDYLRSSDEIATLYARWPQALENSAVIGDLASQLVDWPLAPAASAQGRAYLLETAESRLAQLPDIDAAQLPAMHERLTSELDSMTRWGDTGAWIALTELARLTASEHAPIPHDGALGLPAASLLAYALGLSTTNPLAAQADTPEAVEVPAVEYPPVQGLSLPQAGREKLVQELTADYGSNRVAHATCALDLLPIPALEASAHVLNIAGDLLRAMLLSATDNDWQAFAEPDEAAEPRNTATAKLASLALSLKGAPVTFRPDPETITVAPRTAYPGETLADWGPLLPNLPWSAETLSTLEYPLLHLPANKALDTAHAGLDLARRYPTPGFAADQPLPALPELTKSLKAGHPSAYIAGALSVAWRHGGSHAVAAMSEDIRKLGVRIDPPHLNYSAAYPTLQRDGDSWSVLWGIATLPGWRAEHAHAFIAARPASGFTSLAEVAEASIVAGVTLALLQALIQAGAADSLGDRPRSRQALLSALPAMLEWAQAQSTQRASAQLSLFSAVPALPPVEEDLHEDNAQTTFGAPGSVGLSPQMRYKQRLWEEHNIGVGFTVAQEMESLKLALEKSGGLTSRLISTHQVIPEQMHQSLYLVGILTRITLLPGESGDTLAIAHLEDLHGVMELVALPPNYKRHAALWTENNPVVVTARVAAHPDGDLYLLSEHLAAFQESSTDDTFNITIKAPRQLKSAAAAKPTPPPAQPAYYVSQQPQQKPALKLVPPPTTSDVPRPTQSTTPTHMPNFTLIISIPDADEDQPVINSVIALKRLLEEYPGHDTVTLRVPYIKGEWKTATLSWGVQYSSQLESRIRRLLGDDAIAVIQLAG